MNWWQFVLGSLIGAAASLLSSWLVASRYFKRQRKIDEDKEKTDVELSYARLVNSLSETFGKRLKNRRAREAMSELEGKLKVYNRAFDPIKLFEQAGESAAQLIKDHPESFEDIPPTEQH